MTVAVVVQMVNSPERVENVARCYPAECLQTWDEGEGFWPTRRKAWTEGINSGASHVCVLDDDLKLCTGLVGALEQIAILPPGKEIVSLFSVRLGPAEAKHWCISWDGLCGAAVMMPAELVTEFLLWEQSHTRPDYIHDDTRLVQFALHYKKPRIRTWTPSPCLVDHGDFPSLLGEAKGFYHSRASAFLEGDASQIDWSEGIDDPKPIGASNHRFLARIRDERLVRR